MSDEPLDDADFFQQDFTTASEWEVFNARLEEQIHEWRLPFVEAGPPLQLHDLSLCDWHIAEERVQFADVEMVLTHYRCKVPPPSPSLQVGAICFAMIGTSVVFHKR